MCPMSHSRKGIVCVCVHVRAHSCCVMDIMDSIYIHCTCTCTYMYCVSICVKVSNSSYSYICYTCHRKLHIYVLYPGNSFVAWNHKYFYCNFLWSGTYTCTHTHTSRVANTKLVLTWMDWLVARPAKQKASLIHQPIRTRASHGEKTHCGCT